MHSRNKYLIKENTFKGYRKSVVMGTVLPQRLAYRSLSLSY